MSEKPLLFLDVDGVVCLEPRLEGGKLTSTHGGEIQIDETPQWVNPWVKDWLLYLDRYFEVEYLTGWHDGAVHVSRALGLPEWPILDWRRHEFKLQAIKKRLEAGGVRRRWVWVDDDASWEQTKLPNIQIAWTEHLILNPESKIGLTKRHVEQIMEYFEPNVTDVDPVPGV